MRDEDAKAPKGGGPAETARPEDRRKSLLRRAFRNIPGAEVMARRGSGSGAAGAVPAGAAPAKDGRDGGAAPQPGPAAPPASARSQEAAADGRRLRSDVTALGAVIEKHDLYKRLGVPRDAPVSGIKAAYLTLVKRYHPDRAASLGLDAETRATLNRVFSAIQEAWEVLARSESRAAYDRDLGGSQRHPDRDDKRRRDDARMKFKKGEVLFKKKDLAGALPLLKAAFDAEPGNGDYRVAYAWALHVAHSGGEKDAEVKNLLAQAVRANARADLAHYYLGLLARMEGELDRAELHFRTAIEKNERLEAAATELRALQRRRTQASGGSLFKRMLKKE